MNDVLGFWSLFIDRNLLSISNELILFETSRIQNIIVIDKVSAIPRKFELNTQKTAGNKSVK
jgi:hypothetical protein